MNHKQTMKNPIKLMSALAALFIGAAVAYAGQSVSKEIQVSGGYDSASGSWSNIPSGALVIVEAAAYQPGSEAYASGSGGGVNESIDCTYNQGGEVDNVTTYSDSISYDVWATGYAYAFTDVQWGY